ncbi:MAG: ribosomal-processing cysteine protease Prp [Lachnospiraceae bacterium]|nr:ribosomal-processing cysteine protease Prp [Lachnospiraceae bacterium]
MIYVVFRKDKAGKYKGFNFIGHANSAPKGEDLVCCAASMLAINTINSIEKFAGDKMKITTNEEEGLLDIIFEEDLSDEAMLLVKSLDLGMNGLAKDYESYINLKYTEV